MTDKCILIIYFSFCLFIINIFMASLKDVARLAGVSLMTVSRAINNPEQLSEKTRKAVQNAIEQLNYVPNIAAQKFVV
ncbi:periplasmic binding protein/LacI transcriptional regulator [Actinobacillus equuli]|nr:periplasmic binding protein/LacI transcriptional regulator [Actinobacillus equuli]